MKNYFNTIYNPYLPPSITIQIIEAESSIAAGSVAMVSMPQEIYSEWETEELTNEIEW